MSAAKAPFNLQSVLADEELTNRDFFDAAASKNASSSPPKPRKPAKPKLNFLDLTTAPDYAAIQAAPLAKGSLPLELKLLVINEMLSSGIIKLFKLMLTSKEWHQAVVGPESDNFWKARCMEHFELDRRRALCNW